MVSVNEAVAAISNILLSGAMNDAERNILQDFISNRVQSKDVLSDPEVRAKATDILQELGFRINRVGFEYFVEAILVTVRNPSALNSLSSLIYPMIAKKYCVTTPSVQKAMYNVLDNSLTKTSGDIYEKYFGNSLSMNTGRPTISQTIKVVASHIGR